MLVLFLFNVRDKGCVYIVYACVFDHENYFSTFHLRITSTRTLKGQWKNLAYDNYIRIVGIFSTFIYV